MYVCGGGGVVAVAVKFAWCSIPQKKERIRVRNNPDAATRDPRTHARLRTHTHTHARTHCVSSANVANKIDNDTPIHAGAYSLNLPEANFAHIQGIVVAANLDLARARVFAPMKGMLVKCVCVCLCKRALQETNSPRRQTQRMWVCVYVPWLFLEAMTAQGHANGARLLASNPCSPCAATGLCTHMHTHAHIARPAGEK